MMLDRRNFWKALAVAALLMWPAVFSPAWSQPLSDAEANQFATRMFNDALTSFSTPNLSSTERQARLRALLETYSDAEIVSPEVTGRYWAKATPAQQAEFPKVLLDYVVANYSQSLSDVEARTKLDIKQVDSADGRSVVYGLVTSPNDTPSNLEMTLARNAKGAAVAVDLAVDGVSIVKTVRADFTAVLRANGGDLDKLMAIMKARVLANNGGGKS